MATSGSKIVEIFSWIRMRFSWEQTGQSVANNTTDINWKLELITTTGALYRYGRTWSVTIDGTKYSGSVDVSLDEYDSQVCASGTATVSHNADGTKTFAYSFTHDFSLTLNSGKYMGTYSGQGSDTLTTIPRASSLTAANGTLGTEQTLTINRAASSFKHRLTYKCGDVADYIAGSPTAYTTETAIKWTPPIGLAHENTTGTSVSVTLTLYTYASDGTHVGTTTKAITYAIPTSVKPSVAIAWADLSGAAGLYGNPVQGLSRLEITLTEQTSYSSPIASRSITANGATYNTSPATTGALTAAGSQKIAATIKDQRGRSGSNSVTLDVLAYTAPVVSKLTVHRCNEDGTENDQGDFIRVVFSAAITALNNKNTATYKLRYKVSAADYYGEDIPLAALAGQYTVTDYGYIFAADGSNSYDVEIVATDNHGTATRATSASTAFTLLNWHPSGTGMGVGKVSEAENTMEVALMSDFQGDVHGRVMGLGGLPVIPAGSDFNNYTEPGCWAVTSNADASNIANIPIKQAGRLYISCCIGSSTSSYREQRFVPYNYANPAQDNPAYVRYFTKSGSTWDIRKWINEALKAYPIGSIHLRYDTKNPADLFGGTWTQITARVLRAGAAGSIGAEGTLADGSGRTYIDVAVWRRTA